MFACSFLYNLKMTDRLWATHFHLICLTWTFVTVASIPRYKESVSTILLPAEQAHWRQHWRKKLSEAMVLMQRTGISRNSQLFAGQGDPAPRGDAEDACSPSGRVVATHSITIPFSLANCGHSANSPDPVLLTFEGWHTTGMAPCKICQSSYSAANSNSHSVHASSYFRCKDVEGCRSQKLLTLKGQSSLECMILLKRKELSRRSHIACDSRPSFQAWAEVCKLLFVLANHCHCTCHLGPWFRYLHFVAEVFLSCIDTVWKGYFWPIWVFQSPERHVLAGPRDPFHHCSWPDRGWWLPVWIPNQARFKGFFWPWSYVLLRQSNFQMIKRPEVRDLNLIWSKVARGFSKEALLVYSSWNTAVSSNIANDCAYICGTSMASTSYWGEPAHESVLLWLSYTSYKPQEILSNWYRFGNVAGQFKTFWDSTGQLWMKNALDQKPFGTFISTATQHGGQVKLLGW